MASVTIHAPKTPITEGSNGIAAATTPNVCKMPGPPAPFVPTPLPNIGKSGLSPQGYSITVQIEGKSVAIGGAKFGSIGDVASKASGGGIVSMNTEGPTLLIGPGALDVQIEGKPVHLLGDQTLNNCGPSGSPPNAATMMGAVQTPGQMAINVEAQCAHCGKPLGDPSHNTIKTNDKKMLQAANDPALQRPPDTAKTVGAMNTESGTVATFAGGGDGKIFNLVTKQEIPLSNDQARTLEEKGNPLGNCCEQKLLRRVYIDGRATFPPPGGVGGVKMGVAHRIKGKPSEKELRAAVYKAPCGTCKRVLVAMTCANDPPK